MSEHVYEYFAGRSHWAHAIDDLKAGWSRRRLWLDMAHRAFNSRYQGAAIGAFWLTITTALTALGLGILYGRLFGHELEIHLPYVTTGIVVFTLVTSFMTSGCMVFVGHANIFKEFPLPLSLFPFRLAASQLIYAAYRLIVLVGVLLIFPAAVQTSAPLALVGLAIIFWIGFWFSFVFGVLNARYRDFGQMVAAATTFLFFMTPIFWRVDRLGDLAWIVEYNPFYHLINIVRGPLIGEPGVAVSYVWALAIAAIAPALAFLFYGRFAHRLPYWC